MPLAHTGQLACIPPPPKPICYRSIQQQSATQCLRVLFLVPADQAPLPCFCWTVPPRAHFKLLTASLHWLWPSGPTTPRKVFDAAGKEFGHWKHLQPEGIEDEDGIAVLNPSYRGIRSSVG